MTRSLVLWSVVFAFASCATPSAPEIRGRYASRFADSDLSEIKLLISHRRDIKHSIAKISADRPDYVLVESPEARHTGEVHTTFVARKRAGKWIIDESSIDSERVAVSAD